MNLPKEESMSSDIKISQSITSCRGEEAQRQGSLSAPDQKISDMFQRAMEEKPERHDLESGRSKKDDLSDLFQKTTEKGKGMEDTPSGVFSSMTGMTNPLDNLFSGRMEQAAPTSASVLEGPEMEKLVEQILVSTPEQGGHEVRLSLGGNNLQGTEIVLQRGVDGGLFVSVNCDNPSSFQTLVSAQAALKAELERMEKAEVRVEVSHNADREENDTNRRSRGYMAEETNPF
ncbi:type III secretion protein [Mailhella massiliensis]|uniref:Type III secretion protein n=1 Tax=Mailhella massiliensis TaxID=1903261 RepID=A0A921DTJ4_9BACT|nr:type III secretion protein [Mailhella massiliensis]HJD98147.1 type III secretion protein [Mailhella massiliensis]